MNLAETRWLKTDGPRGIDRYIDYFGAVDPSASHPGDAGHRLSLNDTTGGHPRRSPTGHPRAASEVRTRVMKSDDQWLIDGLECGEADAIEAFVGHYSGWIHRVAARLLGDPRDAEETTQDILMTVVQKIGTFNHEAALSSWVYRIAASAAYERLRSRRSPAEIPLEPLLPVFDEEGRHVQPVMDWSSRLDHPAIAGDVRSALERGIGRLAEEYRAVLVLRDVERLTNEEVAAALGLTAAAVKSRLHRARLFLRRELGQLFAVRDASSFEGHCPPTWKAHGAP